MAWRAAFDSPDLVEVPLGALLPCAVGSGPRQDWVGTIGGSYLYAACKADAFGPIDNATSPSQRYRRVDRFSEALGACLIVSVSPTNPPKVHLHD